jgi:hypothetical protein
MPAPIPHLISLEVRNVIRKACPIGLVSSVGCRA